MLDYRAYYRPQINISILFVTIQNHCENMFRVNYFFFVKIHSVPSLEVSLKSWGHKAKFIDGDVVLKTNDP